jgi:hypothetical protein
MKGIAQTVDGRKVSFPVNQIFTSIASGSYHPSVAVIGGEQVKPETVDVVSEKVASDWVKNVPTEEGAE